MNQPKQTTQTKYFTTPSGEPNWPAANAVAQDLQLRALNHVGGAMTTGELDLISRAGGIHPKVANWARRELARAGVLTRTRRLHQRRWRTFWSLAIRSPVAQP